MYTNYKIIFILPQFTVKDDQSILYHMLLELLDAGEFPNVKVFVKPKCYRKYRIDECNYIKELLEYNREKVYAILDMDLK